MSIWQPAVTAPPSPPPGAGWENDGDIIMDKHRVRRHYLLTWLLPELISSLPYDILAVLAHEDDKHSYRAISLRAIRFLGLLRWPRLWRYVQKCGGMGLGWPAVQFGPHPGSLPGAEYYPTP